MDRERATKGDVCMCMPRERELMVRSETSRVTKWPRVACVCPNMQHQNKSLLHQEVSHAAMSLYQMFDGSEAAWTSERRRA
jgi:hypothetical protein